ncbi:unnamed protein product [Tuber aestivum]|uniref:Uncharacterized protein n=1 Tax=Tuber aestivum TaxID=59557 RepID=A0A292Q9N3_9PEZI|nr:unnamed protein product [Tuber aestivum]
MTPLPTSLSQAMSTQFDPSTLPMMTVQVASSIAVRRLLNIDPKAQTTFPFDGWSSTTVLLHALEAIREELLAEHHNLSRAKLICHYWADDFLRARAYGWWHWFHYEIAWNSTVASWEAQPAEQDVSPNIREYITSPSIDFGRFFCPCPISPCSRNLFCSWSDAAQWVLSMLCIIASDEEMMSLNGGASGPKSVAMECLNVLVRGEPNLPEFKWDTRMPTGSAPAWMSQGKTPNPNGPEYFTSRMVRWPNGNLNVFMRPLAWTPMPDLGQVDIFDSDPPDAPTGRHPADDYDSDYESGSEVIVAENIGGSSEFNGIQETREVEEVVERMEEMEVGGEEEEEELPPHGIQLQREEEEEAVRNAIERREALIRDSMDPSLASNFDYDYDSIDEEGDYTLH